MAPGLPCFHVIDPIQDRRVGHKGPATSFSPVTSTNVETNPKNVLTFTFKSFASLV